MKIAVVIAYEVDSISSTNTGSADSDLIRFHVRNVIEDQMERGRIHKNDIVDRNIWTADEAEQSRVLAGGSESCDIPLSINSSEGIAREDLDIRSILDKNGVSTETSVRRQGNQSVDLHSIGAAFVESHPGGNCIC